MKFKLTLAALTVGFASTVGAQTVLTASSWVPPGHILSEKHHRQDQVQHPAPRCRSAPRHL
jgi:hypothetical protein